MAHEVVERVEQIAAQLAGTADDSERLGKLSEQSVALIRQAGVMRMLQPTDFGFEERLEVDDGSGVFQPYYHVAMRRVIEA